jgi:aminomethyltransferase
MQSMNIRRIEAGILDSGSDFDTTMTPFEAGLERFVDFKNKEFIGRDALQSRGSTNLLFGVQAKEIIPMRGDQMYDDARQVGIITTGAWSPFLKHGIGYVRFEKPADWSGKMLTLKSKKSGNTTCQIIDLPFYDEDKRLPRNLPNFASN